MEDMTCFKERVSMNVESSKLNLVERPVSNALGTTLFDTYLCVEHR